MLVKTPVLISSLAGLALAAWTPFTLMHQETTLFTPGPGVKGQQYPLLMNPEKPQKVVPLQGNVPIIMPGTLSQDGKAFASACSDNTIRVWDVLTGKERVTLAEKVENVVGLSISPDGKLLASRYGGKIAPEKLRVIDIWNAENGKKLHSLRGVELGVRTMAFNPNGDLFAVGDLKENIKIWNVTSGKIKLNFGRSAGDPAAVRNADNYAFSFAFSPDGRTLAAEYFDGTIKFWELSTGQQRADLYGGIVNTFSPDGRLLATGFSYVTIWDVHSQEELSTLKRLSHVRPVRFSPDGRALLFQTVDGVQLWQISNATAVLAGKFAGQTAISFGAEGGVVIVSYADRATHFWPNAVAKLEAEVRQLIGDLGHQEATSRTKAAARLVEIGVVALDELKKAAGHGEGVAKELAAATAQAIHLSNPSPTMAKSDPVTVAGLEFSLTATKEWQVPNANEKAYVDIVLEVRNKSDKMCRVQMVEPRLFFTDAAGKKNGGRGIIGIVFTIPAPKLFPGKKFTFFLDGHLASTDKDVKFVPRDGRGSNWRWSGLSKGTYQLSAVFEVTQSANNNADYWIGRAETVIAAMELK